MDAVSRINWARKLLGLAADATGRATLIVFCKLPVAHCVKTRLIPALGADGAAKLAEAFLLDLTERLAATLDADFNCVLCFDPPDAEAALRPLLAPIPGVLARFSFLPQSAGDLGERLANALTEIRKSHPAPFIFIGTDAPDIPLKEIEGARIIASIDAASMIGADDGGYILLALPAHATPEVFNNINWSTRETFAEQFHQLHRSGVKCYFPIASHPDVDQPGDLQPLLTRLKDDPLIAPRTLAFLKHLPPPRS